MKAVVVLALTLAQAPVPAPPSPVAPAANVVTVEVPVVGRNLASAKQRALEEGFFLAVDRAFATALAETGLAPPLPAAIVQQRAALKSRARRYIRSYRVLSEQEGTQTLRIDLETDVDELTLRREIERARGPAVAATGIFRVLVTGGPPEAVAAVGKLLQASNVRADARPGPAPAFAAEGFGALAMVEAASEDEGPVRGTGQRAARCRLGVSVTAAGAERPGFQGTRRARAFGAASSALPVAACFERAAESFGPELLPVVAGIGTAARAVTLYATLDEPAAFELLDRTLRKLPSVSSAEPRRIALGQVEFRVGTRLPAGELAAAIVREAPGLELDVERTIGDMLVTKVRMRAAPPGSTP